VIKVGSKSKSKYTVISIVSLIAFFGIWELITDVLKIFPSYLLPSPVSVVKAFINKLYDPHPDGATLLSDALTSLRVVVIGYLIGGTVGTLLGIFMAWNKRFDWFAKPLFDLIRPIPPVAWIPVMLLLLGIGVTAKSCIIALGSFVPCVINSYSGIKQTSTVHIWVAETFGASRWKILRKVAIPSALPQIFTGLRVGLGAAWMSVVAAELLASDSGLGYLLQASYNFGRADIIVVAMLTIGGFGALSAFILGCFQKWLVRGE